MRAVLTIATLLVLVACSSAAPPQAAAPTALVPAATLLPTATPAPSATAATTPFPHAKLLRDIWPPAPPGTRTVSALVYSTELPHQAGRAEWKNAIRTFNLSDPLKSRIIAEFPANVTADTVPVGQVSPDGSMIAYIVLTSDNVGDLYVMQRDGSGAERVATNVPRYGGPCYRSFVWSPDSNRLASLSANDLIKTYDDVITIYDRRTRVVTPLVAPKSGFLISWNEPNTVLAMTMAALDKPLVLERIDTITHQRQEQFTFSTIECAIAAPDQQHVLIQIGTDPYVFTMATKTLLPSNIPTANTVWYPNSSLVVTFEHRVPTGASVYANLRGETIAAAVTVHPPVSPPLDSPAPTEWPLDGIPARASLDLLNMSPDGRYFVFRGDDPHRRDPDFSKVLLSRVLIYDSATDHWQQLRQGRGRLNILGWE